MIYRQHVRIELDFRLCLSWLYLVLTGEAFSVVNGTLRYGRVTELSHIIPSCRVSRCPRGRSLWAHHVCGIWWRNCCLIVLDKEALAIYHFFSEGIMCKGNVQGYYPYPPTALLKVNSRPTSLGLPHQPHRITPPPQRKTRDAIMSMPK